MTAIEAYIFLDERLTMLQIIGSLIILSAVLLVQLEKAATTPRPRNGQLATTPAGGE